MCLFLLNSYQSEYSCTNPDIIYHVAIATESDSEHEIFGAETGYPAWEIVSYTPSSSACFEGLQTI